MIHKVIIIFDKLKMAQFDQFLSTIESNIKIDFAIIT